MSGARVRLGELLDGRYRLEAVAGRGGIGVVHRAVDTRTGDAVQVTVLYARIRAVLDADAVPGMLAAVAGLPADLLAVPLAVATDPVPALVTAPIDGRSLAAVVAERPLEEAVAAALGARLAEALQLLHDRGLVHGLLRPAAVALRREDGRPLLLDAGVAALLPPQPFTAFERLIGSAAYVSPEQVWNEAAGPAADVYALALVLLEALTGAPAFTGTSASDAVGRTLTAPPIPADISSDLAALLTRMTAFRPEDRPTAAAVAAELGRIAVPPAPGTTASECAAIVATLPMTVAPAPAIPLDPAPAAVGLSPQHPVPARRPRRRRSRVLVVAALALVACALTAGGSATPDERTAAHRSPVATSGEGRRISAEHAPAPSAPPSTAGTVAPTPSPSVSVAAPATGASAPAGAADAPVPTEPAHTAPSRPRPSASARPTSRPTAHPTPKPTRTATPVPTVPATPEPTATSTVPAPPAAAATPVPSPPER